MTIFMRRTDCLVVTRMQFATLNQKEHRMLQQIALVSVTFYSAFVFVFGLATIADIDKYWPYPMMPLLVSLPVLWFGLAVAPWGLS